jgi:hypothetical protein
MADKFSLKQAPPPDAAPIQPAADRLGLCAGLRVQEDHDQFRCAECNKMQPSGSTLAWVPDGVRRGDPAWSVTESARRGAFNGHSSGWCLSCAQSLSPRPGAKWVQSLLGRLLGS